MVGMWICVNPSDKESLFRWYLLDDDLEEFALSDSYVLKVEVIRVPYQDPLQQLVDPKVHSWACRSNKSCSCTVSKRNDTDIYSYSFNCTEARRISRGIAINRMLMKDMLNCNCEALLHNGAEGIIINDHHFLVKFFTVSICCPVAYRHLLN